MQSVRKWHLSLLLTLLACLGGRGGLLQTDGDDRPKVPPVIKGAEVIWNPFEDIEPRTTPEERQAAAAAQA